MERGNKTIDKSMVKTVFEGNILIPLPKLLVENRFHSLFSIISPTHCDFCGTKLNVNSHYTRFILTSYGTTTCNTTYRICPNCKKNFHDQIVGVSGSANYRDDSMTNKSLSDTMVDAALTIPVESVKDIQKA